MFFWLSICPLFRARAFNYTVIVFYRIVYCCNRTKRLKAEQRIMQEDSEHSRNVELDELQDAYLNMNSFLYSSLNVEIVCAILKGINVVLREINLKDTKQMELVDFDFKEIKVARLKNIQVLNRSYFEKEKASKLKKFQKERNKS